MGPLVGNNVENVNRHIPNTFIHIDTKLMRVMATIFQQCLPLAALSASANSRHGPSSFVSHVFLSMVSGVAVAWFDSGLGRLSDAHNDADKIQRW